VSDHHPHEISKAWKAHDAIARTIAESRAARVEEQRRARRRKWVMSLVPLGFALTVGVALTITGASLWLLVLATTLSLFIVATTWFGATLDPHGDDPPEA
jgi:hypothetical protein